MVDGDSVECLADLGWRVTLGVSARLVGINAIEHNMPGGKEATVHLASLIPPGTRLTLDCLGIDKFGGRSDCRLITALGVDVGAQMVTDGYAAAWSGNGPKPVPPWPIPAVDGG